MMTAHNCGTSTLRHWKNLQIYKFWGILPKRERERKGKKTEIEIKREILIIKSRFVSQH